MQRRVKRWGLNRCEYQNLPNFVRIIAYMETFLQIHAGIHNLNNRKEIPGWARSLQSLFWVVSRMEEQPPQELTAHLWRRPPVWTSGDTNVWLEAGTRWKHQVNTVQMCLVVFRSSVCSSGTNYTINPLTYIEGLNSLLYVGSSYFIKTINLLHNMMDFSVTVCISCFNFYLQTNQPSG